MSPDPEEGHAENLNLVKPAEEPAENVPDEKFITEETDLDREAKALGNLDTRQAIGERRTYLPWIIGTPIAWSVFVAIVLVLTGFRVGGFHLPDAVYAPLIVSVPVSGILAFGAHLLARKPKG
jgi:hypothetical protein